MTSKHPKEITVYMRIGPEIKKKLQKIANEKGVGVSTLLRIWAMEKLKDHEADKPIATQSKKGGK